jgi:hypothetical protein
MADRQRVGALLELGWSHRRIARDRDPSGDGGPLRGGGSPKPANPIVGQEPSSGPASAAAACHEFIEQGLERGLTAQRIWQDLGELYGYPHG